MFLYTFYSGKVYDMKIIENVYVKYMQYDYWLLNHADVLWVVSYYHDLIVWI